MTNKIELRGCAPAPLLHYLKALGILRLVAEQLDPNVRAAWQGDSFVLESQVSSEELLDFFLNRYCPTPIVAPWNNGSGFHSASSGDGKKVVHFRNIRNSTDSRLELFRQTIEQADALLKKCLTPKVLSLESTKRSEALKPILIPLCRNNLPDKTVQWLDTAALLTGSGEIRFPPLLGSAGNDGNLEFSLTFMGCLYEVLSTDGSLRKQSNNQLKAALFGNEVAKLVKFSPGQFQPAGGGGVNASNQVKADELANPWDFILAVEGALFFAGAAVRRMAAGARGQAAFPFFVAAADIGTTSSPKEDGRGELFLPIWERPASFLELHQLFSEGRVRLNNRKVVDTLHFARAIAELGIDRGITKFHRHRFLTRNGKMQYAVSMGSIDVPQHEIKDSDRLRDFDSWLDNLRKSTRDEKKSTTRFRTSIRKIDEAIFQLCSRGSSDDSGDDLRAILLALGDTEAELAKNKSLNPLFGLRENWAWRCDDKSAEYEIAAALASIKGADKFKLPSLRGNLEAIDFARRDWSINDASVVWGAGTVAENLSAILQRRSIDARSAGSSHPALLSKRYASLRAIEAFLNHNTSDPQIENLLWGLAMVNWKEEETKFSFKDSISFAPTLPRAYALLKLLFLPDGKLTLKNSSEAIEIKHEPTIIPLLRAGRVNDALQTAVRRLRVSGLVPMTETFDFPDEDAVRLAAALLIPIHESSVRELARLVLRAKSEES